MLQKRSRNIIKMINSKYMLVKSISIGVKKQLVVERKMLVVNIYVSKVKMLQKRSRNIIKMINSKYMLVKSISISVKNSQQQKCQQKHQQKKYLVVEEKKCQKNILLAIKIIIT